MSHFLEQPKRASAAELISAQALRTARLLAWLSPMPTGSLPVGSAIGRSLSSRLTSVMPTRSSSGSSPATFGNAPCIITVRLTILLGSDTSEDAPMSEFDPTLN